MYSFVVDSAQNTNLLTNKLLYGCEVWCSMMTNLASKLLLRFYKIILKSGKSTPTCIVYGEYSLWWTIQFMVNYTVYGELGQFPLELQTKTRMLNFWFKLVNINCKHKFSNIMYKFLYDMCQAGIYKSPFCLVLRQLWTRSA